MPVTYPFVFFAEPVSCWTHLGAAFIFLCLILHRLLQPGQKPRKLASWLVFSLCSVLALSMSGIYHLLPHDGEARMIFQRLDHAAIYMLIAGTFTAVHDILFAGLLRWGTILVVWATATTGITVKTVFFESIPEWIGLLTYLGFGWLGVASGMLLYRKHGFVFMLPLLLGGVAYTGGALLDFFRPPALIEGIIGPHELFHVAVIAGIGLHWCFISRVQGLSRAHRRQ